MLKRVLASAAAVALTAGAANAQFLLYSDENDNKQVVNRWAGERMIEGEVYERRAARIPQAGAERRFVEPDPYDGGAFRTPATGLTPGAPLGLDPYSGEKRVVGGAR